MDTSNWNREQLTSYMETTVDGMTESQILESANYLLNRYEDKKRMTELQGDNMSYGDSHDDKDHEE